MINKLTRISASWLDSSYVLRFLLKLAVFYLLFRGLNLLMVGVITPGGQYSSFVATYLNYVTVLKVSILQAGAWLAGVVGAASYMLDDSRLQVVGGGKLIMAWACCGLEIMSFWAAFVLADTTPWRTKLRWCLVGLAGIWAINCLRVCLLVMAHANHWRQVGTLSHHDSFNVVAYALIFLLMFLYYRKNKYRFDTA